MRPFSVILYLVACATLGFAQNNAATYKIKAPDRQAGAKYEVVETDETDQDLMITNEKPTQIGRKFAYTESIEKMDGRVVTRMTRSYSTAETNLNGKTTKLGFHGKTVLIERIKDDMYSFKIDGKDVAKDDLIHLEDAVNEKTEKMDFLLPTNAIKVGEKWTVDNKKLAEEINKESKTNKIDAEKLSATGILKKAYQKGTVQYGEFELTLKTTEPKSTMEMTMVLDGIIDGSGMDHTAKMTMKTTVELAPGKMGTFNSTRTRVMKTIK